LDDEVFRFAYIYVWQSEYIDTIFTIALRQLLSLMPYIEDLSLADINYNNHRFSENYRLNLPKLRKLSIESCNFEVVDIFNYLDDDILDELSLYFINGSPDGTYFENQRNIKKITTNVKDLSFLNFQQMNLDRVSLPKLDGRTLECLKGQDKITYASFYSHTESSKLDLKQLKSLEILSVDRSDSESQINLSSNLKIMRVIVEHGFASIKSETLQELMFERCNLSNEQLEQLASTCPSLRALKVWLVDIDSIFVLFPKLESLCCYRASQFTQTFDHQHLKFFCVRGSNWEAPHDTDQMIKVVKRCVNLESLEFDYKLTKETVKELLRAAPRLKALSLSNLDKSCVKVIKKFGGHLESFRSMNFHGEIASEDLEYAKHELKYQFDEFKVGNRQFTAKKKGSAEIVWYS
jgi:hypothetical protein